MQPHHTRTRERSHSLARYSWRVCKSEGGAVRGIAHAHKQANTNTCTHTFLRSFPLRSIMVVSGAGAPPPSAVASSYDVVRPESTSTSSPAWPAMVCGTWWLEWYTLGMAWVGPLVSECALSDLIDGAPQRHPGPHIDSCNSCNRFNYLFSHRNNPYSHRYLRLIRFQLPRHKT
jgi:hypothetical protein